MAGNAFDEEDEITGINVTPLVDVMLVLLIIFMVTTTYIVQRTISVKLPKAETAEQKVKTKNIAFVLDKNSNLFLDGKSIEIGELTQHISKLKKDLKGDEKFTDLQALITADTLTPHGSVVKLIDVVRKNGIFEFAINVELKSLETIQ